MITRFLYIFDGSASVTTESTAALSVTTEDTLLADFADFGDNLD